MPVMPRPNAKSKQIASKVLKHESPQKVAEEQNKSNKNMQKFVQKNMRNYDTGR